MAFDLAFELLKINFFVAQLQKFLKGQKHFIVLKVFFAKKFFLQMDQLPLLSVK
jgi:hypothetical protein